MWLFLLTVTASISISVAVATCIFMRPPHFAHPDVNSASSSDLGSVQLKENMARNMWKAFKSLNNPIRAAYMYRDAFSEKLTGSNKVYMSEFTYLTIFGSEYVYKKPQNDLEILTTCVGNSLRMIKTLTQTQYEDKCIFSFLVFKWLQICQREIQNLTVLKYLHKICDVHQKCFNPRCIVIKLSDTETQIIDKIRFSKKIDI